MIIFLYGEDTYRSSQKLQQIISKFKAEVDETGMNLSILDGVTLKFEQFNQHVKATPFLSRKRMVVIKNLISQNKSKEIQKEIVNLLSEEFTKPNQDNIIVFWEAVNKPKDIRKNQLWQRLVKEKFAEEFKPLTATQINHWITSEIKNREGEIDKSAIPLLAATIGNDLWQISNEIDKLISYKSGQVITGEDIETLVKAKFDDDIFKLIDALANKNKKDALRLISEQINAGANEMYLLTMLIRQFRILLMLKDLQQENQQINKSEIASKLKIHPFVAQKSLWQVKNFTLEQLKQIYLQLLDIDLKIKTSSTKAKTLFDLFIVQI
ncbi:DNA polymerase III subunit delta [Patescibacteria group bacterium]